MFLSNYIELNYFLFSLFIGILITYIVTPEPEIIIKYPTPDNIKNFIFKDNTDNCYKFISNNVKCPIDKSKISKIPLNLD